MKCSHNTENCLSEQEKQFLEAVREGNTIRLSADAFDRATSGKPSDMSDVEITFTEFVDEEREQAVARFYEEPPEWAKTVALHRFFSSWAKLAKEGDGHFQPPVEVQWRREDGSIEKTEQCCITSISLGDQINTEAINEHT